MRLNIQFEITYSTTVVGFNTTMLLVVLMERCNFVSAGIETESTGHFTYRQLVKGFRAYITEASVVAKKQDCKTYNWRFKTTEVMSKETYLLTYSWPHNSSGSSKMIIYCTTGIQFWCHLKYGIFHFYLIFMYIPSY